MIKWLEDNIARCKKNIETGIDDDGKEIDEGYMIMLKKLTAQQEQARENVLHLLELSDQDKLQFDTLGHYMFSSHPEYHRESLEDFFCSALRGIKYWMIENYVSLETHIETGELPKYNDERYHGRGYYLGCYENSCRSCGESYFEFFYQDGLIQLYKFVNGKITTKENRCPLSDGLKPYDVYIDIPSGEMLLANVVHGYDFYDEDSNDKNGVSRYNTFYSLNNDAGKQNQAVAHSEQGSIQLCIGNCSCEMFQVDDSGEKFIVGDGFYGEEWDYKEIPKSYTRVGDVCTDWWGYCVVDKKEFVKRQGDTLKSLKKSKYQGDFPKRTRYDIEYSNQRHTRTGFVIKCKAGRYRFRHQYLCKRDDPRVYTYVERVGDCGGELPLEYIGKPK